MEHSTRARQALARLPEVDPAIAALSLWCRYRDGTGPTVTDGETIYVGPEFPLLPISEQTGVIAHHVMHVALRHSSRRAVAHERYGASFRADVFDLACDAIVNEALLQGGHALPRPAVRAADLVEMLPANERPENLLADWDADALYAALSQLSGGPGGRNNDSVKHYARTQGFEPDLKDSDPDKTEADVWAGRIEQAMGAGQRAGSGIGAILTRFGDLPKGGAPWEVKLRRLLGRALAQHPHQSHRRPARAWLARDALARRSGGAQPVFEPGLVRALQRPRLVIGLDTSSSIRATTLDMFAAEAISMVRRTGSEAYLLGFDTEVHSKTLLQRADAITSLTLRRGGGTDFDAVLTEAQALDPSMIVVLTDLDAPMKTVVTAPLLWAVPAQPSVRPRYGDILIMDNLPAHWTEQTAGAIGSFDRW